MIQLFFVFSDWAILLLRLVLGLIFIAHGWPKIKNLKTTQANFDGMGFKPGKFWGSLVALAEFFGGILMILGLFTQVAAFILALEFIVIMIWKLKIKQKLVGGYELDLILLAALLALATAGSSLYSLDSYFRVYLY